MHVLICTADLWSNITAHYCSLFHSCSFSNETELLEIVFVRNIHANVDCVCPITHTSKQHMGQINYTQGRSEQITAYMDGTVPSTLCAPIQYAATTAIHKVS